jgi:hypothetical protein
MRNRIGVLSALMLAGTLALPGAVSSQTPSDGMMSAAARLAPSPLPTLLAVPAWPSAARIEAPLAPAAEPPQARNRSGVPLMVAGGALLLGGAIAGGDGGTILMLSGVVIGSYGTYRYFGGGAR